MIVRDLVPEIYYRESRDFSYVGRLFEILFNYLKTNVDLVGETPINNEVPDSIVDLVATTLGFESKHKYQTNDLVAICSAFTLLLRNKGNALAIEQAITILLHTQGIEETFEVDVDEQDRYKYIISVPKTLDDIILLEDVLDYILPTGMTYTFRLKSSGGGNVGDNYDVEDSVNVIKTMKDYQLGQVGGRFDNNNKFNTIESEYDTTVGTTTTKANRSMTYTSEVVGADNTSNNEGDD